MATARKPAVDPLVEELPPEAPEPLPTKASEVKFTLRVFTYVLNGEIKYQWEIIEHTAPDYVGNYVGQSRSGFDTKEIAENNAKSYVQRIRDAIHLKLIKPEAYTITL